MNGLLWALVAMILCVFNLNLNAAQGFDGSMIAGSDNLRNYALKQVKRGFISLSSISMDYTYKGGVTSAEVVGDYAEEVLAKLGAVEFVFRLTNPDDAVNGYLYLYDANNNLLFYGSTQFKLADLANGKPKYSIWIQEIPLSTGVVSAEVLALNPDGTTGGQVNRLRVNDNGQLLFQPWMAGVGNGLLVVKYKDGDVLTYRLANPENESTPSVSSESSEFSIQGHYVFKDPSPRKIKILALWDRPTVFLELTVESPMSIEFDIAGVIQKGSEIQFERPTAIIAEGWSVKLFQDVTTNMALPKGKYRFKFQWKEFGSPGLLYTGPSDNGKG
ncbi:MAG: hypothetical protein RLZZ347_74 [Candidatus Parcubacteria bacterium]